MWLNDNVNGIKSCSCGSRGRGPLTGGPAAGLVTSDRGRCQIGPGGYGLHASLGQGTRNIVATVLQPAFLCDRVLSRCRCASPRCSSMMPVRLAASPPLSSQSNRAALCLCLAWVIGAGQSLPPDGAACTFPASLRSGRSGSSSGNLSDAAYMSIHRLLKRSRCTGMIYMQDPSSHAPKCGTCGARDTLWYLCRSCRFGNALV